MTINANQSGFIDGEDEWVLIASSGSVLVNSSEVLVWAMTSTLASPVEGVPGHPFNHLGYGVFQHTIDLVAGQNYHVFIPEGVRLSVLATVPAS